MPINTNRLEVRNTTFTIGDFEFAGYTADEIDPVTGAYINYLSGGQLSQSIGNGEFTTRAKNLPKSLKALLPKEFSLCFGVYKNERGGLTNLNLWRAHYAAIYWIFHFGKGNDKAGHYLVALASTTLDVIINDSFGRAYKSGDAQKMVNARIEEMRSWVKENYNQYKYFLRQKTIREAGFTEDEEVSYMLNEAYLKEKSHYLSKILSKKNISWSDKTKICELMNSMEQGLIFRKWGEDKMSASMQNEDYRELMAKADKVTSF